jgi:hypothetical protein
MIYHFKDLHEPFAALVSAIKAEDKTASPIYDAYIRGYQDWNEMRALNFFVLSRRPSPIPSFIAFS